MNSNCCKVCEGKEQEIIHDLSKVFVSPTLGHLKNIVEVLNDHKCSAEIIRQEI